MNVPIGTIVKVKTTHCYTHAGSNGPCVGSEGYISTELSSYPAVHFEPGKCRCIPTSSGIIWCSGLQETDIEIIQNRKELI